MAPISFLGELFSIAGLHIWCSDRKETIVSWGTRKDMCAAAECSSTTFSLCNFEKSDSGIWSCLSLQTSQSRSKFWKKHRIRAMNSTRPLLLTQARSYDLPIVIWTNSDTFTALSAQQRLGMCLIILHQHIQTVIQSSIRFPHLAR